MKILLTLMVFLGIGLSPSMYSDAPSGARHTQRAVLALEARWAAAQKVGNVAVVKPMLADTFVNPDAEGETYGKEKLLLNLKGVVETEITVTVPWGGFD